MKYVLTGGGSGGHIYPLLSFANVVKKLDPEAEFLFVGKKGNMEAKIVPQAGLTFVPISTSGTKGVVSWQNVKALTLMSVGYVQAHKIIREFKPDVCLGGGGYVSVPLMLAANASQKNIVTAVLESDQFIGKANLKLAQESDLIFGGLFDLKTPYFPNNEHYYHVGHPRMQELYDAHQMEIEEKQRRTSNSTVLFVGGSLGAQTVNEQAIACCEHFVKHGRTDIEVRLITGERYYEAMRPYEAVYPFLTIIGYSDNIAEEYLRADLLVCRASAGVLAEATTFNLPFIAVPSPNVMRNHQWYNGEYFAQRGAGLLFNEVDIVGDTFASFVVETFENTQLLASMKAELKKLMHKDGVTRMYTLLAERKGADG